jgi:hypothetical protein
MNKIKAAWAKLLAWCHNSETIVLARATVLFGIVLGVVQNYDLTALVHGDVNWKQAVSAIAWGVAQEVIRKYRAEDLK